jgi:hypothetical protein
MVDEDGNEYDITFVKVSKYEDKNIIFLCKHVGPFKKQRGTYMFHYWTMTNEGGNISNGWTYNDYSLIKIKFDVDGEIYPAYKHALTSGWIHEELETHSEYRHLVKWIVNTEAENAIFNTETIKKHDKR